MQMNDIQLTNNLEFLNFIENTNHEGTISAVNHITKVRNKKP